jgi:iron complex outermembrane receptor protein
VQGQPGGREENARLGLTAVYTGWRSHRLRLGSGFHWGDLYEVEDLTNYEFSGGVATPRSGGMTRLSDTTAAFLPEAQRTSHYGFIQDEWAFAPDWELTAGVRHDHYSDFGDTTNPRLALVWATTPWLTSKLLYGEAFRPPAFIELYARNNPIGLGNPSLEAEKLRSTELALQMTPSAAWAWDINLYDFRIRDFIDFSQDAGGSFTAQNVGRIHGYGAETELRYQPSASLRLLANYSYQHTEDEATGRPLGLAPRDKLFARAIWSFRPQWQLTPQLTRVGERKRQAGDARADLEGDTTFDMTLRWLNPREQFNLALIARNLFDADVREPSRGPGPGQLAPNIPDDLPQAGRSVMLEASARW